VQGIVPEARHIEHSTLALGVFAVSRRSSRKRAHTLQVHPPSFANFLGSLWENGGTRTVPMPLNPGHTDAFFTPAS
jgi:hypothetical protein